MEGDDDALASRRPTGRPSTVDPVAARVDPAMRPTARRAVHAHAAVARSSARLLRASRRRTSRGRGPGRGGAVRAPRRRFRRSRPVAEGERHLAFAHDLPVHPGHPAQAAHLAAQAHHRRLEEHLVARDHRPSVAHAVDAHEVDEARAVLGLGQDQHRARLGHGLGEDRGGQHGNAPRARDEVALVRGDVLDARRSGGPPRARGCGPREGRGSGGAGSP